jgi:hypothetical protein
MTSGANALLYYLIVGSTRIIMSTMHMAVFAEIGPFPPASGNGSRTVVNPLPYKKRIWSAMWFMAISTRQDIVAALVIIIRIPEIGITTAIAGSCPAMFFSIPVKLVKVSSKLSTVDIV